MKKILVTGGNGFIGYHLTELLARQGYKPVILDITRPLSEEVESITGDITRRDTLSGLSDIDGIVHLCAVSRVKDAMSDPARCMEVNVLGTINVIEFAKASERRPWIVMGSTIEPPKNVYGLSKHLADLCAGTYSKEFGLSILALKFSTVYGSRRDIQDKLVPRWINNAGTGQEIKIDNPKRLFDFIYIEDVVAGISAGINYVTCNDGFETVPICTGVSTSLEELAAIIINESRSSSKIVAKEARQEEYVQPDPEKARKMLRFEAITPIRDGIRKLLYG